MNTAPKFEREKQNWERVATFTNETTLITVEVSRLPISTPTYSMAIGRMVDDRLRQNFHIRRERSLVDIIIEQDYESIVATLMAKAMVYIRAEMKKDLDTYLESRYEKDRLSADRGKPATKVTGKTEKNRAKVGK